jgi:hypothetical protein
MLGASECQLKTLQKPIPKRKMLHSIGTTQSHFLVSEFPGCRTNRRVGGEVCGDFRQFLVPTGFGP